MKAPLEIIGGSNYGISNNLDVQRSINLYVHTDKITKRNGLLPFSGLTLKTTISEGSGCRKLFAPAIAATSSTPIMFSIQGEEVFLYDDLLNARILAALQTTRGYVGAAANNGAEVLFVDGVEGYLYNIETDDWTQISRTGDSAGFPTQPADITYMDGYYICIKGNSNQFFISGNQGAEPNDGSFWNALDSSSFTTQADSLVACRVVGRSLFLMGHTTTEIWEDVGSFSPSIPFPFAQNRSYAMEFGCLAVGTVKEGFGILMWLGVDKNGVSSVLITKGSRPERVSTKAVTSVIDSYTQSQKENATAIIYEEGGHIFYGLSFPNNTWIYDVEENIWTEKQNIDGTRDISECHAYFLNQNFVGDYRNGNLYLIDKDNDTDNNLAIKRIRIMKEFLGDYHRLIRVDGIELDIERGLGEASGESSDPKLFLSISKDSGRTFGRRVPARVGKIGEFKQRVLWYNLGIGYTFTFKLEYEQSGKFMIARGVINYEFLE